MAIPHNICIIMPHLDDEFALSPLLKLLPKDSFTIIYIAERHPSILSYLRRRSCRFVLSQFGVKRERIIFLNDRFEGYFLDLSLHAQYSELSSSLVDAVKKEVPNVSCFVSLTLEGGHPDHDIVALQVEKLGKLFKSKTRIV